MQLAKQSLDVGVYTNRPDEMRAFYEHTIGLPYEELLKAGGGVHQHRFGLRGSVFKLNDSRQALDEDATCYRRLAIAFGDREEAHAMTDPDGLGIDLVPRGEDGVDAIAVHWATRDPARLGRLLMLGFDAVPDGDKRWRVGSTLLILHEDRNCGPVGPMRARGFRYLTVQVQDVKAEHAALLDAGWTEGHAPMRLGDVAYVSFVRDPDGSWIEVSQRASLTGALPD